MAPTLSGAPVVTILARLMRVTRLMRVGRPALVGLALALGVSCCLAACGAWKSPSPAAGPPRKIQVMSSDGWIHDVMGENAKQFEKESCIKVSFTIYAPHVYFRALQTMLASGEAADIFLMQSTRWYLGSEIDPEKSCIDLTSEEWTKRLKPEWLPAVSYKGRVREQHGM